LVLVSSGPVGVVLALAGSDPDWAVLVLA
jgi:hypothetical protein